MAPGERQLGFLKADSPLAFQEQGPTSSIIQHTLPHCLPQQDGVVVCGRVCLGKIKLLFEQDKCTRRKGRQDSRRCERVVCEGMSLYTLSFPNSLLHVR